MKKNNNLKSKKSKPLSFHILSLFPESMAGYLDSSILGRAQEAGILSIKGYQLRDHTVDKHGRTDFRPYAGGPGMVMAVDPIVRAVKKIAGRRKPKIILFRPGAKLLTNELARKWLEKTNEFVLICGRYEGIDARVKKILKAEEVSIGPYVLTGGELPAMITVDVLARQWPGVLGNSDSPEENRVASGEVYTRPEVYEYQGKKYRVPKVLLTGHHEKIEEWKKKRQSTRDE